MVNSDRKIKLGFKFLVLVFAVIISFSQSQGVEYQTINGEIVLEAENYSRLAGPIGKWNLKTDQVGFKGNGYCMEVALPWADLFRGLADPPTPASGLKIGFDLFNYDRERAGGNWIFASWSVQTNITNNDNPSEWGTLILEKKSFSSSLFIVPILVLGILFFGFWKREKGKSHKLLGNRISSKQKNALFKTTKGRHFAKMELAVEFLKSNLHKRVELKELGDHLGLGYGRLRQLFVTYTGKSYTDFIVDLKLENARRLLKENPELSISEIATKLGYDQLPQFSIIFKKRTGLSPLAYREKMEKKP